MILKYKEYPPMENRGKIIKQNEVNGYPGKDSLTRKYPEPL
jgi:hypothetical protein